MKLATKSNRENLTRDKKSKLFWGVAGLALMVGSPAFAEAAASANAEAVSDADASTTLTDVIVTAQKRESSLQKTPISISVFNADALADRHIQSLENLNDGSIPSLRVEPFFTRSSALIISVRGIGAMTDANQPARDQGVGVYVDGVYMGRAQGLGTALYDIDRIEVEKGPQGTLFGRNTEGGAVSIVTKKPTGEFGLNVTVGAGDYGAYKGEVHLNLPAVNNIAVKIDGLMTARDGTVQNPLGGQQNFNAYDKRGVRFEARWTPNSRFDAEYAYDNSYDATTPYYAQILSPGAVQLSPIAATEPDRATTAEFGVPQQWNIGYTNGHLLNLDWKAFPNLTVKSITSYRELGQTQFDDGETVISAIFSPKAPTASFGRYSEAGFWQHQFSQELQLIGSLPQITYASGLFYYSERVHDNAWTPNPLAWAGNASSYIVLPTPAVVSPFPDRASHAYTDSSAVYGQATWTPAFIAGDMAHLTLGGRYTSDHKTGTLDLVNGSLPVINPTSASPIVGPIKLNKTWDRFDPLINFSLDATPDLELYAKWSTGYKAGGANSRSYTYRAFDPETVSMGELGAKGEFLDHRLRANLALFDGSYDKAQIDFNAVIIGSNRGTLETTNATGSGTTRGAEGELTYLVSPGFTVSANYAYTEVSLPKAPNPFAGNALVPVYALNTPRNAFSFSADYQKPIDMVTFKAHLDVNASDGYHAVSSDPTLTDKALVVNGRLALADIPLLNTRGKMQISAWVRNLANEEHTFYKSYNVSLGTYGIFNEPRTYGVEANVKY